MFSVGELVLYGAEGVCRVVGIEDLDLTGEMAPYYRLAPESDKSSCIFVPMNNSILTQRIKPLLSKDEIEVLVADKEPAANVWCDSTNLRKNRYHEIVNSADRKRLISLVRELYLRRNHMKGSGQRFSVTDEHYFKLAQRILYDEFSRVIPLSQDEFLNYLIKNE